MPNTGKIINWKRKNDINKKTQNVFTSTINIVPDICQYTNYGAFKSMYSDTVSGSDTRALNTLLWQKFVANSRSKSTKLEQSFCTYIQLFKPQSAIMHHNGKLCCDHTWLSADFSSFPCVLQNDAKLDCLLAHMHNHAHNWPMPVSDFLEHPVMLKQRGR